MEVFSPIEKPNLEFFGAAAKANACGHPFVNIAELSASRYHYLVVIELPRVKCYEAEVEWNVNGYGEVTIEGQIDVGDVFGDVTSGLRRRRVQLCPTEPWAVTFYLPGPVEWWTPSVIFKSSTVMELMVRKDIPLLELAADAYAVTTDSIVTTVLPPPMATNFDTASSLGVVSPSGMTLLEMIAMADTSTITTIPPIPPTYTVTTIPAVATNSDVASSLSVGSPRGMSLFEMIAMTDTSTITNIPSIPPTSTITSIPPVALATNSDMASSLGVGLPTRMDLFEMMEMADTSTIIDIPPVPSTYTLTNIPPVSTFAATSTYDVASSLGDNSPEVRDMYERIAMAIAYDVANSPGVNIPIEIDIDEMIAGWLL